MLAYISRIDTPISGKIGMLIPWDQEEILNRSKLRKSVLSLVSFTMVPSICK